MVDLETSKRIIVRSKDRVAYAALCDVLLFFVYGYVLSLVIDPTSSALARWLGSAGDQAPLLLSELLNSTLVPALGWLLITFVSIYAIIVLLVGSAFYHVLRACAKKTDYKGYLGRFAFASIFWFALFIAYQFMAVGRDLIIEATGGIAPWVSWFMTCYLVVLVYFGSMHVTLVHAKHVPLKRVFAHARSRLSEHTPYLFTLFVTFLLLDVVLRVIPASGFWIIIQSLLLLAWIGWARIVWVGAQ